MGKIVIYMRHGCHLCDEAEQIVRPLALAASHELELVDIETDDELHRRFLELIPVIELDGVELARLVQYRDGRLQRALAGA